MRWLRRLILAFGVAVGLAVLSAYLWRVTTSIDTVRSEAPPAPSRPIDIRAEDWPMWRGPFANGISLAKNLPVQWSATENVVWKSEIPGRGHASPCVVDDQVIVATADEERQEIFLLSFDRSTGTQKWSCKLHSGGFMAKHAKNSFASPTPCCDGTLVYYPAIVDGEVMVSAVTLDGKLQWQTAAGPYVSEWGYGSSLCLYGATVIVAADNRGSKLGRLRETSFLASLSRADGQILWRIKRPNERSYGTPIVAPNLAGRPQLLLGGPGLVAAYDPQNGEEIWSCATGAERVAGTIAFDENHVYSSAFTGKKEILCIRADGKGDVTDSHVVWRESRGAPDVPSPLLYEGALYLVDDAGIAQCLEAATGKPIWRSRLRGKFSASPVAGAGHIYISNEDGVTYVIRPDKKLEIVFTNELNDPLFASPALTEDHLFLRSSQFLFCIGSRSPSATTLGAKEILQHKKE